MKGGGWYLPSRAKFWCTLQLRGQLNSSYFSSTLSSSVVSKSGTCFPLKHTEILPVPGKWQQDLYLKPFVFNWVKRGHNQWRGSNITRENQSWIMSSTMQTSLAGGEPSPPQPDHNSDRGPELCSIIMYKLYSLTWVLSLFVSTPHSLCIHWYFLLQNCKIS